MSLAITTLTLSHFRSHRTTRMAFDGRPVAIIGPNGAGKTNILEAISLLSPGRGLRRATAADFARRPEMIGWKVAATVRGLAADHEIDTYADHDEARVVRIDDKAATQAMLGHVLRVLWLVPAMDRLWIESAEGRRRFLDRMTLSFFPEHAEVVLGYDKAMRERNRLLKDQVADAQWYGALERQMSDCGLQIMQHRAAALSRIGLAQQGAASAFPHADLSLLGPDDAPEPAAEALAAVWSDGRRRDMAAGRTLIGPHRTDMHAVYTSKATPAAQCSTGEQKALLISLILSNARALTQDLGRAPVLLLDEVAAHLDADRRAALYDEVCALGAQAIMTGTEASLFEGLGMRAQMIEVADLDGESRTSVR